MSSPPQDRYLLAEIWSALLRRRVAALLSALIVFSSVLAYTAFSSRWYRSEAKLFVRVGRESVSLDPTATIGQVLPMQGTRENEINSVYQVLLSQELAAAIVDQVGPARILYKEAEEGPVENSDPTLLDRINPLHVYNLRDLAIKKFTKLLDVKVEKDSSVISISFDAKDPALAREVVQMLIGLAQDTYLKVHSTQGSEGFFAQQSVALKDRVLQLERQLRDLRNESAVADVRQQREIQVERIGKLQEQMLGVQAQIVAAEAELAEQQASIKSLPETIQLSETTGLPNTAADGMRQQLFALQIQEKELLAKNQEESIQLQQIREQVNFVKQELETHVTQPQLTKGINQIRLDLRSLATRGSAELAALRAQSAVLGSQIGDERVELAKLNDYELKLAEVERQLELEVASYRRYVEKLEQARIDLAMERDHISNLNLLQQPTFSVTPVFPHVALNLAIGMMLSLMAGVAVAVSMEMLSSSAVRHYAAPVRTAPLTLTPGAARM